MKFKPPGIPPVKGGNIGLIQVKVTSQQPATPVGQKAPNNFHVRRGSFPQTNDTVRKLDDDYKQLPATGPGWGANKASWEYANTYYSPWELCSCDEQTTTGQKLYRNWNLNRSMLLIPHIQAPILEAAGGLQLGDASWAPPGNVLYPWLAMIVIQSGMDGWFFFNQGKGLQSELIRWLGSYGTPHTWTPPPASAFTVFTNPAGGPWSYCAMSDTGRPTNSRTEAYHYL